MNNQVDSSAGILQRTSEYPSQLYYWNRRRQDLCASLSVWERFVGDPNWERPGTPAIRPADKPRRMFVSFFDSQYAFGAAPGDRRSGRPSDCAALQPHHSGTSDGTAKPRRASRRLISNSKRRHIPVSKTSENIRLMFTESCSRYAQAARLALRGETATSRMA